MSCDHCRMPEGYCAYPWYGMAPHEHVEVKVGNRIGWATKLLPRETWPANFVEDPDPDGDGLGLGTYTHCPHCGASDEEEEVAT